MNSENKTAVVLIAGIVVMTALYFIWCKPETAEPIITIVNALIGFLVGAVGAVINALKI